MHHASTIFPVRKVPCTFIHTFFTSLVNEHWEVSFLSELFINQLIHWRMRFDSPCFFVQTRTCLYCTSLYLSKIPHSFSRLITLFLKSSPSMESLIDRLYKQAFLTRHNISVVYSEKWPYGIWRYIFFIVRLEDMLEEWYYGTKMQNDLDNGGASGSLSEWNTMLGRRLLVFFLVFL